MLGKARLNQTIFYHFMTYPLFAAGPEPYRQLCGCHELDVCPRARLKEWLSFLGIHDKAGFETKLRWLFYEGHRCEFNELSQRISTMSAAVRRQLLASFREDGETEHKLKCVNQWMHIHPPANIAAFDFALLTALSRAGARRRWLKESEANGDCLEAAKMAQTNYTGWSDFFAACIAGACFYFPQRNGDSLQLAYARSLLNISGAIPSIDWNHPLK